MTERHDLIEQFYDALGSGDIDRTLEMYADEAEIVRYDGVAHDASQRRSYLEGHLQRHPGLSLNKIVEVREADDVVMWDALVDTDHGIAQMFHVMLLDDQGRIWRHVPGLRGYWGG